MIERNEQEEAPTTVDRGRRSPPRCKGFRSKGKSVYLVVSFLLAGSFFIPEATAGLASRVMPVDLFLLLVAYVAALRWVLMGSPDLVGRLTRLVPAVALWCVSSLLAILLYPSVALEVVTELGGLAYFLVPLVLVLTPRLPESAKTLSWGLVLVALLFAGVALSGAVGTGVESRYSAVGGFANPNHTASWAAAATLVILAGHLSTHAPSLRFRVLTTTAVIGLVVVQLIVLSFASISGLLAALCVTIWYATADNRRQRIRAFGVLALAGCAVLISIPAVSTLLPRSATTEYQRSGSDRAAIWHTAWQNAVERPFGGGSTQLQTALGQEAHNEYLNQLLVGGVVALVIFVLIGASIYRLGGVATKSLVVFWGVVAVGHNIFSWRHAWLFLAIGLMFDMHSGRVSRKSGLASRQTTPGKALLVSSGSPGLGASVDGSKA